VATKIKTSTLTSTTELTLFVEMCYEDMKSLVGKDVRLGDGIIGYVHEVIPQTATECRVTLRMDSRIAAGIFKGMLVTCEESKKKPDAMDAFYDAVLQDNSHRVRASVGHAVANALETSRRRQVDGTHYETMAMDPISWCELNKFTPLQFCMIKHAARYPRKDEDVLDLKKVIDYAMIALKQYGIEAFAQYSDTKENRGGK
jgi:hypothetical protein